MAVLNVNKDGESVPVHLSLFQVVFYFLFNSCTTKKKKKQVNTYISLYLDTVKGLKHGEGLEAVV